MPEFEEVVCPQCQDVHRHVTEAEAVADEVTSAEVEIARINAERDIALAKLQAGVLRDEVVVEAAVEAAHAEGEAEGLREAVAPPEPVEEAPPAAEPVVVVQDVDEAPEVEAPPEAEPHHEHHEPRKHGLGAW